MRAATTAMITDTMKVIVFGAGWLLGLVGLYRARLSQQECAPDHSRMGDGSLGEQEVKHAIGQPRIPLPRIKREAASVSSRNSATPAPRQRFAQIVLRLIALPQEIGREI
jgi:hypothetical protein